MFSIHNFSLNREKLFSLLNRDNFIKRKIVEEHYKIIKIFIVYKFIKEKLNRFVQKNIRILILE